MDSEDKKLPKFDNLAKLDEEIGKIQRSTKTSLPFLTPLHEKLRMTFRWYYKWHLNPFASLINLSLLAVGASLIFFVAGYALVRNSERFILAASAQTWGTQSGWNDWQLNNVQLASSNKLTLLSTNSAIGDQSPTTAYSPAGTATIVFDPAKNDVVDWLSYDSDAILNNQTITKEFSTDNILFTPDISTLANSKTLYIKLSFSTSDTSISPELNSLTIHYSRLPSSPDNLSFEQTKNVLGATSQVLHAGVFSDPDNDFHQSSQWQITGSSGKYDSSDIVHDSKTVTSKNESDLVSYTIPENLKDGTYYFRARYQDTTNAWGLWSKEYAFTITTETKANPSLVDKVTNNTTQTTIDNIGTDTTLLPSDPNEVVSNRTGTTETIDNKNGTNTLQSFSGQIHYKDNYQDPASPWKNIDPNHYIDYPDYVLYDQMPSTVKVFKSQVGYEITSRASGESYTVTLQSVDGTPKLSKTNGSNSLVSWADINPPAADSSKFKVQSSKLAQWILPHALAEDTPQVTKDNGNLKFEFAISENGVRLWKTITGPDAPKNFKWNITKTAGTKAPNVDDLKFRSTPDAYDVTNPPAGGPTGAIDTTKPVAITAQKISGDMNSSFTWQETAPKSDMKIDTDVTYYPDANTETTTVDGYIQNADTSSNTWATVRNAASGTAVGDSDASMFFVQPYRNSAGTSRYIARSIFLFDTSPIASGATISAATFSVYGASKADVTSIAYDMNIYSSNPASNTALATGDYSSLGSTAFSTAISVASFSTTGYNNFALNSDGIANIAKGTGAVSKFGARNANYDVANTQPAAGGAVGTSETAQVYFADQTGTANDPKLAITYSVASPPTAPSGVNFNTQTTTGFTVGWTDNSSDETGFKVYTPTTPTSGYPTPCDATITYSLNATTAANAVSETFISSSVNLQYCAKVTATNANGDSTAAYAAAPLYTLANVPSAPTVSTTSNTAIQVVINVNSNPSATTFAIYNDTASQYVQANGTLGASAVWQDYTTWGGASGVSNTGLTSNTAYTYKVKALNGDSAATALSSGASATTTVHTITSSAGANGSISPSGATTVGHGADQAFTISPSGGYYIASIVIDSSSQTGALSSPYTFTNVTTDHTIAVTFTANNTRVWDGGGSDNNWNSGDNWTGNTVPVSTDDVIFNSTNTKASTIDGSFGGSAKSLSVNSGYTNTITEAKDLTLTNNLTVAAGTLSAVSYTINVGGSVDFTGGTFTCGASTINFNTSAASRTINTASQNLYNFTVTLGTITAGSNAITVTNNYSQGGGTFTAPSSTMTVTGNFSQTAGTFTHNSGTIAFNKSGDQTIAAASSLSSVTKSGSGTLQTTAAITIAGTLTIGSSTTFDQNGLTTSIATLVNNGTYRRTGQDNLTLTTTDNDSGTFLYIGRNTVENLSLTATPFNTSGYFNLTINDANASKATFQMGANLTVAGVLTVTSGTFQCQSYTLTLSGTGTPLSIAGTFTAGTGTVSYTGGTGTNIAAATYNNLGVKPSANSATHTLGTAGSQTITVGNDLTLGNGTNTSVSVTAATNNPTIDVNGSVTIAANTTFTGTSGTITVANSWTNSGTFTHNNGTVTFDGSTASQTITTGGSSFYNMTVNGQTATGAPAAKTWYPITDDTKAANFTPSSGTDHYAMVDDPLSGAPPSGYDDATTTLQATTGGVAQTDIYTHTVDDVPAGATGISVTFYWRAASGGYAGGGSTYSKVGVQSGSSTSYTSQYDDWVQASPIVWTNHTGTAITNNPATSAAWIVSGINASKFLLNMSGGAGGPGTYHLQYATQVMAVVNYTTASADPDWTLQDALTATNNLTVSSSTLTAGNNSMTIGNYIQSDGIFSAPTPAGGKKITVSGGWNHSSGTFTHDSGNVTFAGDDLIEGDTTFYDLTHATGDKTMSFTGSSTQTITHTLSINGTSGHNITLQKKVGDAGVWDIDPQTGGTRSVSYVAVSNSTNLNATHIDATTGGVDNGSNTGWDFPAGNTVPTNDSLTFTNPYSTNVAIADNSTVWDFQAKVTDLDGTADLSTVDIGFANSADSTTPYNSLRYRWTNSGDAFTEVYDTQTAASITSTSADSNASGNQWTLDFKIKFNTSFLAKDTSYAMELYSVDSAAASDTDNYAAEYQVTALSISMSVDSGTLSFGSLLPGSIFTGTTVVTTTTNYPNGYSLSVEDGVSGTNSALLQQVDGTTRISDYGSPIATPTAWSGTGLGICVFAATGKNTTQWGTGTTTSNSSNLYAGVPQTTTPIHSKTGSPTSSNQTSVGYKLVVPNSQKTGLYSGSITYTVTGVMP